MREPRCRQVLWKRAQPPLAVAHHHHRIVADLGGDVVAGLRPSRSRGRGTAIAYRTRVRGRAGRSPRRHRARAAAYGRAGGLSASAASCLPPACASPFGKRLSRRGAWTPPARTASPPPLCVAAKSTAPAAGPCNQAVAPVMPGRAPHFGMDERECAVARTVKSARPTARFFREPPWPSPAKSSPRWSATAPTCSAPRTSRSSWWTRASSRARC